MKKLTLWILICAAAACGKKKETSAPLSLDVPLLAERNLDSVRSRDYAGRLLAFAIDLGQRNIDLDKRIGLILSVTDGARDWHEGVELVINRPNYQDAETSYLAYLEKYEPMLDNAPSAWDSSRADLVQSRGRLKASYNVIRGHSNYDRLPAMLDTLLSNDLSINRSLRDFEQRIKRDVLP